MDKDDAICGHFNGVSKDFSRMYYALVECPNVNEFFRNNLIFGIQGTPYRSVPGLVYQALF